MIEANSTGGKASVQSIQSSTGTEYMRFIKVLGLHLLKPADIATYSKCNEHDCVCEKFIAAAEG